MMLLRFLREIYCSVPPDDPTQWHPVKTLFPRRGVDGGWVGIFGGTVHRRRHNGRWEFRQDTETREEWENRQW